MRVACPDCSNPIETEPGLEVVCPACMTRFTAADSVQVPRRFDIHLADGTLLPHLSVFAIREAIYTGRVPITARMRPDIGSDDLLPVYNYPPFSSVFSLLGIEPPTSAGTRKIAGWRGVHQPESAPAPVATPALPAQEKARRFLKTASLPLLLAAGVGGFFVLLVGVALYLAL
jgi:hypothetical protein